MPSNSKSTPSSPSSSPFSSSRSSPSAPSAPSSTSVNITNYKKTPSPPVAAAADNNKQILPVSSTTSDVKYTDVKYTEANALFIVCVLGRPNTVYSSLDRDFELNCSTFYSFMKDVDFYKNFNKLPLQSVFLADNKNPLNAHFHTKMVKLTHCLTNRQKLTTLNHDEKLILILNKNIDHYVAVVKSLFSHENMTPDLTTALDKLKTSAASAKNIKNKIGGSRTNIRKRTVAYRRRLRRQRITQNKTKYRKH